MKTVIFLFLFVLCFAARAQSDNPWVKITVNDIEFENEKEKEAFEKLAGDTDYLKLLFYSGGEYSDATIANAAKKVADFAEKFRNKKFDKKSSAKKIKQVFTETHDAFFIKYEYEHHFKDIFSAGTFNCVSGTALYAMLFDKLQIPYVIKEQPTHVYLVAYPDAEKITVEATDPTAGYVSYNSSFKTQYAKMLRDAKLITADEYDISSPEEIFEKYFKKDSAITFRQLVGLQYHNEAIYFTEDEKYEEAYIQAAKAHLLYPSEVSEYTMFASLASYLDNKAEYREMKDVKYMEIVSRFKEMGSDDRQSSLVVVLSKVFEKNFKNGANPGFFTDACTYLQNHVSDSVLKAKMDLYSNLELGAYYTRNAEFKTALPYLHKAYMADKGNKDVLMMYYGSLITTYGSLSTENALVKLDSIVLADSGFMKNKLLANAYLGHVLLAASERLIYGSPAKGLELIDAFERQYVASEDIAVEAENVTRAYTDAAVYYFKRGQTAKAKNYLERGLKYAPNSYELKNRLRAM